MIAEETEIHPKRVQTALATLTENGSIQRAENQWIYVTDFIEDNPISSPSNLIHARDCLRAKLPDVFKKDLAVKILATTEESAWTPPAKSTIKQGDLLSFRRMLQELSGAPLDAPSMGGQPGVNPASTYIEEQEEGIGKVDREGDLDREAEKKTPPAGGSSTPPFPSDRSVGSGSFNSSSSPSGAPQGHLDLGRLPGLQSQLVNLGSECWEPIESGIITAWNLTADIVRCQGGVLERVDLDAANIREQIKSFIRTPCGSIKLQLGILWITYDAALWGLKNGDPRLRGKPGGFAARLDKMTIHDTKLNRVHEWAYKILHRKVHESEEPLTIWDSGERRLIGVNDHGNPYTLRKSADGTRVPLESWTWHYEPKKKTSGS